MFIFCLFDCLSVCLKHNISASFECMGLIVCTRAWGPMGMVRAFKMYHVHYPRRWRKTAVADLATVELKLCNGGIKTLQRWN